MADHTNLRDIPSPVDFHSMSDARAWADSAMQKRPWRQEFFDVFVKELSSLNRKNFTVLELGSGPGFLAHHILQSFTEIKYTMLDSSSAMHELARQRLGTFAQHVRFIQADFKTKEWTLSLETFDAVVTLQAVHELRHKRHASELHSSVRGLLRNDGIYLVCDHFIGRGGMTNANLYMTIEEQYSTLENAGFKNVQCVLQKDGLVLHRATIS
jgi:cyclopropane fatty-acyl-phospholipid synthase-like methyltransferase